MSPTDSSGIWAIGGGKGGIGKTFLTATVGLLLSQRGVDVNLIDADLGAPNLHTFLGVLAPRWTLSDFIYGSQQSLDAILLDTPYRGLKLAAGSTQSLNMANLEYFRKQKLLRHILSLDSACTIIDTGAGTSLNSVDFFPISDVTILVVNPDPASVENTYQFLRTVVLRMLKLNVREKGIEPAMKDAVKSRKTSPSSIRDVLEIVGTLDRDCEESLRRCLGRFRPCLIVNKVRDHGDAGLGESIADVVRRYLAIDLCYLGSVPYDRRITACLRRFEPFASTHPESRTVHLLRLIVERLVAHNRRMASA